LEESSRHPSLGTGSPDVSGSALTRRLPARRPARRGSASPSPCFCLRCE
jgi:hypothetical protein